MSPPIALLVSSKRRSPADCRDQRVRQQDWCHDLRGPGCRWWTERWPRMCRADGGTELALGTCPGVPFRFGSRCPNREIVAGQTTPHTRHTHHTRRGAEEKLAHGPAVCAVQVPTVFIVPSAR